MNTLCLGKSKQYNANNHLTLHRVKVSKKILKEYFFYQSSEAVKKYKSAL